jgi:hypothetical protein
MIGIETDAKARIAIAHEIAESRRAQFARHRIERAPGMRIRVPKPAIRPRIRSASRA